MRTVLLMLIIVFCGSQSVFAAYPVTGSGQTSYCQVPPYLTQSVKPNINLILDFSGSMQFPAYVSCASWVGYDSSKVANCGTYTFGATSSFKYDSSRNYYGNFKSDTYYKYNSTSGYFEENGTTCASDRIGSISSNCLSGNLLNWAVTTRTDVLRRILTGGRVKTSTTDVLESEGSRYVYTDETLHCKFSVTAASTLTRKMKVENQSGFSCAIGTFSDYNMDVKTSNPSVDIKGIVHSMYPGLVDLELSVYNTSLNSGSSPYTVYRVGKNKTLQNYLDAINSEFAYNGTPTGEALREAKYYYQQSTSLSTYNEGVVRDPENYLYDPYYESGALPAPCRKSFNLLISDGEWNGSLDPVTPAYDMRTGDMRAVTALPGKQNVTTYAVYAFGDGAAGRQAMITTAIFGGFDDNDLNTWPYPFTSKPSDSKSVTYPRSSCNPSATWDARCAEWDKDKTGLPYNFFEGDDGTVLQQEITKAVNDILGRVSSGTAASILGNNDNNGATLLQALYYPERQFSLGTRASWLGEIQALWYYIDPLFDSSKINLREDTVKDNVLKLSQDKVVSFDFTGTQVDVNLYSDADGDGDADNPTSPDSTVTSEEVKALWRAGLSLWSRLPSGTGGRTVYTNNLSGTATSSNLMSFSTANRDLMKSYLDVPGTSIDTDSDNIINYTLGSDLSSTGYRSRNVTIPVGSVMTTNVWKLGDIINSTPKLLSSSVLNTYASIPPGGYSDYSYYRYVNSKNYRDRGVAFVGANDGMLHAFKLGKNFAGTSGSVLQIKNADGTTATDLGKELWSYVPKNVLPYLKHHGNPSYKHLFYVDSTPMLVDVSIGETKSDTITCSSGISGSTPYYICPKSTQLDASKNLLFDTSGTVTPPNILGTSWRTVLLGSMGLGGATRDAASTCTECVKIPSSVTDIGYSSYFAMDVTDPSAPKLLWEFSNPRLGFSTVRPAIVRIKDPSESSGPDRNGRWFVILANGPTGPIDAASMQMKAHSDQPLTIFVLDLKTGTPLRTFSTDATAIISGVSHTQVTSLPSNAFGGLFSDSSIDTDKGDVTRSGRYSDDAVYLGYIRKDTTSGSPSLNKFAKGGVIRILTGDDPDPANWRVSTVIDGVGPVSSAVTKLQDRTNGNLWLYFGTGRYYYKIGSTIDEDFTGQQEAIYGIKEPCYSSGSNDLDNVSCSSTVLTSGLVDQTSTISAVSSSNAGWKINLATAGGGFNATRIITNPVASLRGILFFTAFKPSTDICSYGGDTSLWVVTYDNGGIPSSALRGQVLIQLSTGAFKQVNLATDLTGRTSASSKGVSSRDEPAVISNANHFPSRRVLHIQER